MNVIFAYLDTMFLAYPQTPRMLEAKVELQGMMEDAYTSLIAAGRSENEAVGQVIRDFGNLEEVAPALGITSDIAPPAPAGPASAPAPAPGAAKLTDAATPLAPVTLDEAQGYADAMRRVRYRLATAIALFVLSPAALIALPVASRSGVLSLPGWVGTFIGLLVLFVLAAIGVILLIAISRETAPFQRIPAGRFAANPTVVRWADALAESHERQRIRALQIAIALWILAPIPLIAFALSQDGSPQGHFWTMIGVVIVLIIVAAGLWVLLPNVWAHTVGEELRRTSARALVENEDASIVGVIAAFYWPLLTVIFLAWSFIGNAWYISWIVWPIGAVLFGAIAAGGNAIQGYRAARR